MFKLLDSSKLKKEELDAVLTAFYDIANLDLDIFNTAIRKYKMASDQGKFAQNFVLANDATYLEWERVHSDE